MQSSPVQTQAVLYRKVHIQPRLDERGGTYPNINAPEFLWPGVKFESETGIGIAEDQVDDPTRYLVTLRLQVQNKEGELCPYSFDVELVALLMLSTKLPVKRREELAAVNGLAIVYGAARELITNMTARMEYGPLVLPGVNFQDQAESHSEALAIAAPPVV